MSDWFGGLLPRAGTMEAERPWQPEQSDFGTGNTAYHNQTLLFEKVQLSFSEYVSLRALLHFALRAAVLSFLVWLIFFLLGFLVFAADQYSEASAATGSVLGLLGTFLSFIAFCVVFLVSKIQEPISEWRTLLEDKAAAASSSYAAIYGSLGRRHIPLQVSAQRIRSDIREPEVVNNRLVIVERAYVAYVSVFPYGTSLYVGWTMWRNRSGADLVFTFVKDVIGSFTGRSDTIKQMLRTEKPRAMREAVHSAVREGVEIAAQGIEVPIASTFGKELPIDDLVVQAPTPPPPPPAG